MDADGQVVVVDLPEQLEDIFGEKPRVGEDQCRAVRPDRGIELGHRPFGRMAAPGDARGGFTRGVGEQDLHLCLRAGFAQHQQRRLTRGRQPRAPCGIIRDSSRQASAAHRRGQRLQSRQRQRQQIAALAGGEGVDLIHDHPPQPGKHRRALWIGQQQRQRFGRGQQDVRGPRALAGLAVGRGVAAARLDRDRQAHLLDRAKQVAAHIMRQRLQRRDVKRVQAIRGERPLRGAEIDQRGQEPCQRLARAGVGHQQRVLACGGEHLALVAADAPVAGGEPCGDFGGDGHWGARW